MSSSCHNSLPKDIVDTTLHFNEHEVKDNPNPHLKSVFTSAFGLGIIHKIAATLQQDDSQLKQQALTHVVQLFTNPINIVESKDIDFIQIFFHILHHDNDEDIRVLTSIALHRFVSSFTGRQLFLDHQNHLVILKQTLKDSCARVRVNAYKCLLAIGRFTKGLNAIIDESYVPQLLSCVNEEKNFLQAQSEVLNVLAMTLSSKIALTTMHEEDQNVIDILSCVVQPSSAVRLSCCKVLTLVARDADCRERCVRYGAVEKMADLLEDMNSDVQRQAGLALMNLANSLNGRTEMSRIGILPRLVKSLQDEDDVLRLSILQTITSLADEPSLRKQLLLSEDTMNAINHIKDGVPEFALHANRASTMVKWTP